MHEELSIGRRRFLDELAATDSKSAVAILRECPAIDLAPGTAHFATSFRSRSLLLVDDGFVVARASEGASRSIITCEAGPGRLLLPPTPDEFLAALGRANVTVIDIGVRTKLLRIPAIAERLVDGLAAALRAKQQATANFAPTHHIERVQRKLLQLAEDYGHVVRGSIRIDFPVSHALLAEMVGSSRETVTRAVDELQRSGFVDRRGSTYRLLV